MRTDAVITYGTGLWDDIPEDAYHRDEVLAPELGRSLSQSGAKVLLRNPARFAYERDHPKPSTPAQELGTAVHAILFETQTVYAIPAGDGRTKSVKDARAAVAAQVAETGGLLLPEEQVILAWLLADAIRTHPTAGRILTGGQCERTAYWVDEQTGVTCRARLDYHVPGRVIVDVKSAIDASPSGFGKAAANFGYHVQDAWYREAVRVLTGEELPYVLVAVEKVPPYAVGVYQLDADAAAAGQTAMRDALERYAEYESSGVFPGYPTDLQTLSLPAWALTRRFEEL